MERIDLKGMLPNGTPAKPHQANRVTYFSSPDGCVTVFPASNNRGEKVLIARTRYGEYQLKKHSVHNYYLGTCKGIKVQVSIKRIVAEVRYWPKNLNL